RRSAASRGPPVPSAPPAAGLADWELAPPPLQPRRTRAAKGACHMAASTTDTNTRPDAATRVSTPLSGTSLTLSLETGLLAQQSQGAVVAQIGETVVLATANAAPGVREGIDFFPLTVDVEERMYAAGKIPGSFFRREGRPSDTAILSA